MGYLARTIANCDSAMEKLGDLDMEVAPHFLTLHHGKAFWLNQHVRMLKGLQAEAEEKLNGL